jgi:hypothetical protein
MSCTVYRRSFRQARAGIDLNREAIARRIDVTLVRIISPAELGIELVTDTIQRRMVSVNRFDSALSLQAKRWKQFVAVSSVCIIRSTSDCLRSMTFLNLPSTIFSECGWKLSLPPGSLDAYYIRHRKKAPTTVRAFIASAALRSVLFRSR